MNWTNSPLNQSLTQSSLTEVGKRKLSPPRNCDFCPQIYKIGVTGGIASGKSSLLQLLKQSGKNLVVVDCDKLGHNTYHPGTQVYHSIIKTFGQDVLGKGNFIDRKKLAEKVFATDQARNSLNEIVWPEIMRCLRKKIRCSQARGYGIIVIEAALLLESAADIYTDEVWALGVPDEEAVKRVVARGLSETDALQRIRAQLDLETRKGLCDLFIDSYNLTREENSVKIFKRLSEIEEIVEERRRTGVGTLPGSGGVGGLFGSGSGVFLGSADCNPAMCRCMFVQEDY